LDPTFYYQFGNNEYLRSAAGGGGANKEDISAWLADVIAGFQLGPVLIEARGTYSPGNKANDQLGNEKKTYRLLQRRRCWCPWQHVHQRRL
jgi:hypothetical protein